MYGERPLNVPSIHTSALSGSLTISRPCLAVCGLGDGRTEGLEGGLVCVPPASAAVTVPRVMPLEVAHEARRTLAANASAASAQAHFVVMHTVYPRKTEPINLGSHHSARTCQDGHTCREGHFRCQMLF